MDGTDAHGVRHRHSLKTRDWNTALKRIAQIEDGAPAHAAVTSGTSPLLKTSIAAYLDDCRARNLAASSLAKYENTLDQIAAFFPHATLSDLTLEALTRYRATRAEKAPGAVRGEIGTFRSFFRFCQHRDWVRENAAARLRRGPKEERTPTLPFTREEIAAMLTACDAISDTRSPESQQRTRLRARALLLTFLYSGMRISDVVLLKRAKLNEQTGQLFVKMMKTGEPLYANRI
jgi:site-specific recombinase XerD